MVVHTLAPDHKQVYAYTRTMDGRRIFANYFQYSASITLPEIKDKNKP